MRDHDDQTSEGLNQIFEIINVKGDIRELNQIVKKSNNELNQDKDDTKP
ncbi:hypothetical protein Q4S57_07975 [Priestia megaterium]|nr:hypothetical protein [Priestia megaterium]MDO6847885.1 hypothetical protein [Priestia megaterium]